METLISAEIDVDDIVALANRTIYYHPLVCPEKSLQLPTILNIAHFPRVNYIDVSSFGYYFPKNLVTQTHAHI